MAAYYTLVFTLKSGILQRVSLTGCSHHTTVGGGVVKGHYCAVPKPVSMVPEVAPVVRANWPPVSNWATR